MSRESQIDEMAKLICNFPQCINYNTIGECKPTECNIADKAEALYNAGYRKQNDEELIDKIATYFEKDDNWTKLKYSWNACGKSVQLRDMLRDAITERK